ncbi:hypothetical protein [Stenotrophomonas sp. RAC2]|uniref:hypothetical protein n=1 Tax=Stenotrophomonas sp. RAC2 TaxID=3064902 RepID=UPI00271D9815|nr:hypothetical protein [Stenotrophomonas sp. RAC2]MDV9042613.1 hypothetical protein [Stenotrophomonas sp. RAC2]
MGEFNRWVPRGLAPLALLALAACSPPGDPAQTVQRDADAQHVPARPVGEAMQMQPTAPAEGVAQPEAVQLRRTDGGGIEIRNVDAAGGEGAEAAPAAPRQY